MWINQKSYTKPVKVKNGTNMLEKTWYYLVYLKMHILFNLGTLILDIYLEKLWYILVQVTCRGMFILALSVIAMYYKQPKYPSTIEWINIYCWINGILYTCENRWTIAIYSNIDAPQEYEMGQQKSKFQEHIVEFHLHMIFKYAKLNSILFRNKDMCHKIINRNEIDKQKIQWSGL